MRSAKEIDINCDLAEGAIDDESQIMPFISSCNICCGAHAGGPALITKSIKNAIESSTAIGAHPSYPDRQNFGRLSLDISLGELEKTLKEQIGLVQSLCAKQHTSLAHIKAHGALYHDLSHDRALAEMFVTLVRSLDPRLVIFCQAGSNFEKILKQMNHPFKKEGFLDRRYQHLTKLVPRKNSDAVIDSPESVIEQLEDMLGGGVKTQAGYKEEAFQTLCIHGDTTDALSIASAVFKHLKKLDVQLHA